MRLALLSEDESESFRLWHGTSPEGYKSILASGFSESRFAYFSQNPEIAIAYNRHHDFDLSGGVIKSYLVEVRWSSDFSSQYDGDIVGEPFSQLYKYLLSRMNERHKKAWALLTRVYEDMNNDLGFYNDEYEELVRMGYMGEGSYAGDVPYRCAEFIMKEVSSYIPMPLVRSRSSEGNVAVLGPISRDCVVGGYVFEIDGNVATCVEVDLGSSFAVGQKVKVGSRVTFGS